MMFLQKIISKICKCLFFSFLLYKCLITVFIAVLFPFIWFWVQPWIRVIIKIVFWVQCFHLLSPLLFSLGYVQIESFWSHVLLFCIRWQLLLMFLALSFLLFLGLAEWTTQSPSTFLCGLLIFVRFFFFDLRLGTCNIGCSFGFIFGLIFQVIWWEQPISILE